MIINIIIFFFKYNIFSILENKLLKMESVAISILIRATEKDKKEEYTMALALYQEGLKVLVDTIKGNFILFIFIYQNY